MSKWVHRIESTERGLVCACGNTKMVPHNGRPTCSVGRRSWDKTRPPRSSESRRNNKSPHHGLTKSQRLVFLAEKGNACEICGRTESLKVDHDHKTKELRGVLCNACNLGLGHFKDSSELLAKAIQYLTR